MALFKRTKKREKAQVPAQVIAAPTPKRESGLPSDLSHVLRHARITEKATMHQGTGVYTFDVAEGTTKRQIREAVEALYKVRPQKIAIVPVPSKARRSMKTGKRGIARGGKKAYVYLKKGETITIG